MEWRRARVQLTYKIIMWKVKIVDEVRKNREKILKKQIQNYIVNYLWI